MDYRKSLSFVGIGLLVLGGLFASDLRGQDPNPTAATILQVAGTYAQGLTAADAQAVRGICSVELWTRIEPAFKTSPPPAAGSLGTYELLTSGEALNLNHARVNLLCRHPDGVEDVVTLTLKQTAGQWKVCGGPTAGTPPTPFR